MGFCSIGKKKKRVHAESNSVSELGLVGAGCGGVDGNVGGFSGGCVSEGFGGGGVVGGCGGGCAGGGRGGGCG